MDKNTQNKKENVTRVTTIDKKKNFLRSLEANLGNISKACASANISRMTYYRWQDDDEPFKESCKEVEEALIDTSENKLLELIKQGNITAIIFHLKTKGKSRGYNETTQLEITKPISEINFNEI